MNPPKVSDVDYIQFLIAAQRVYTCTEAARCTEPDRAPVFPILITQAMSRMQKKSRALGDLNRVPGA